MRRAVETHAIVVSGHGACGGALRGVTVVEVKPYEKVRVQLYGYDGSELVPLSQGEEMPLVIDGDRAVEEPEGGPGAGGTGAVPGKSSVVAADQGTMVREKSGEPGQPRRVLMVMVTGNERSSALDAVGEMGAAVKEEFDGGRFPRFEFLWPPSRREQVEVWLVRTENQRAPEVGTLVARYVATFKFEAVLMVGMCMGMRGRAREGDVLVPTEIFSLSHNRETPDGPILIPHGFRPDRVAVTRMQSVLDQSAKGNFGIHMKHLGCGDTKIEDPEGTLVKKLLAFSTDLYGYEMEGEGLFTSLRDEKVEGLLIKGVADFGNAPGGSAGGSDKKRDGQLLATRHALMVAFSYIEHLVRFPGRH